ncbi:L-lysine 6-transaminase [bacterium]|nr:L-lysine 6-transaminase [bacterium]
MTRITPLNVHETLSKYMLADGFDLVFDLERSQGSYFVDSRHNRKFLDLFSFFASAPVGFNHPKMRTPEVIEKLGRLAVNNITNSDLYTVEMAEFVETFFEVAVPKSFKHSFYVAGGSLGIENALKAAMDWKVRKNYAKGYRREIGTQVLHFEECFHGRTGYTVSMTNTADPNKYKYFAHFDWPRVVNPKLRFPLTEGHLEETEKLEKLAIEQIKTHFRERKDEICAIILEPIQGEGGDNHFRLEFFKALRQLATENDAMLIFDEVQTGVGLTGKMWAFQHYVEPDMFCFGKKTQVCGFCANSRIDEVEDNVFSVSSRINSTWGGNLIDMYRFKMYLEIMRDEKLVDHAARVGETAQMKLLEVANEYPTMIMNVRGRGLMCAFDLPTTSLRNRLVDALYENGVCILPSGRQSIRFRPALNISELEITEGIDAIRKCTGEILEQVHLQPA